VLIVGSASGQATADGAGVGTVRIVGASSGASDSTGSAAAAVVVSGTASGTSDATGSATGPTAPINGEASGQASVTGSSTGTARAQSNQAGQVIGARRRKFRPTIFFDWFKDEPAPEDDYDGEARIVPAVVSPVAASLFAVGEINFDGIARMAPATIAPEANLVARSAWNDPTDEELIALISAVF